MAIGDGMAMCLLHTQQMADLRSAMALATAGAIQWNTPEDRYSITGIGFWIRLMGVDIFVSEHVPLVNASADRGGSMWLPGGMIWCDMSVRADTADAIVLGGKVLFEQVRDASRGITEYVSQGYLGVTRGYDTAPHQLGVSINTDA
jgi:hypothetical protein